MDWLGKLSIWLLWLHLIWLQTDFGCIILIVGAVLHGVFILTRFELYCLVGRKTMLTIWSPNEFESHLLCVYSPAHALMWMVMSSRNWILMVVVMAVLSKQVSFVSWLKSIGSHHDALSCVYWVKPITRLSVTSRSWLRWSECSISFYFHILTCITVDYKYSFWHHVILLCLVLFFRTRLNMWLWQRCDNWEDSDIVCNIDSKIYQK